MNKSDLRKNPIIEGDLIILKKLQTALNTQDNRCTSYPVWRVFEKRIIAGVDDTIAEGMCIVDIDTNDIYVNLEELIQHLSNIIVDVNGDPYESLDMFFYEIGEHIKIDSVSSCYDFIVNILCWDNYVYVPYIEIHYFIEQFITEEGANDFILKNNHRYKNNLITKIESSWNNTELKSIIDIIKRIN